MKTARIFLLIAVVGIVIFAFFLDIKMEATAPLKRDGQRLTDLGAIRSGLEKYRADNNTYPVGTDVVLGGTTAECLSSMGFSHGGAAAGSLYLYTVPKDPLPGQAYLYTQLGYGKNYQIKFETEAPTAGYPQPGKYTVGPPFKP